MAAGNDHTDRPSGSTEVPTRVSRVHAVQEVPTVVGAQTVRCAPGSATSTSLGRTFAAPPGSPTRFQDQGEIAKGGMAAIRKVFDTVILRNAAMKVLADDDHDPLTLSRFVEEAQITGQLDHPNIVPVYDIGIDAHGLPTRFTMKLVNGETLTRLLDEHAQRPDDPDLLERALQVFLKICDAVSFAHSRGVVHRDLKPANVMVGSHGQVYLMDWGIAVLLGAARSDGTNIRTGGTEASAEQFGTLSGTPAYMAPEQAWGRTPEIDERTDVFGLGAILYEIITFQPPYVGADSASELQLARAAQITPPEALQPSRSLPPGLCRIAMRALSPDRQQRYANVDDLKRDVEAFLRGGGWFATGQFTAGTVIVAEGDHGDAAYIVQSGQCRVEKAIDGRQLVIGRMGPGDVFGEAAVFSASPRTATVIAEDDVTVLVVTRMALERELSRSPWLSSFVQSLARRFVDVDRQLTALGRGQR